MKLLEALLNELWLREARSISAEDLQRIFEEASSLGQGELAGEYGRSVKRLAELLVDARIRKLLAGEGRPPEESLDSEALMAVDHIRRWLAELYRGLIPVDHEGRVLARAERAFEHGGAMLLRGDYMLLKPGEAVVLSAAGLVSIYSHPERSG